MLKDSNETTEKVASEILQMRDLLYANIIGYEEYQKFIKKIFKDNKLSYKFQCTLSKGKKVYSHIGKNTDILVSVPVDKSVIDFNLEGNW